MDDLTHMSIQPVPLRVRIRRQLKSLLPDSLFALVSNIWIRTGARLFDVQGIVERYTADFLSKYPKVVQGGPFAGLVYVDTAVGSNYLHKLIGSYEAILHPTIEELRRESYDTIIDIGSAEGYYLAGLGRVFPSAKLVGFEIEEVGRDLTRQLHTKNALTNELVLEGEATAANVTPYISGTTLLICDCEGAELDILDPVNQPAYTRVDTAIIELHDFIRPGIKAALMKRFAATHTITVIPFKMADAEKFPYLAAITNPTHRYELCRERGWQEQEWLILRKK